MLVYRVLRLRIERIVRIVIGMIANDVLFGVGRPFPVQEVIQDQVELVAARLAAQYVEEEVEAKVEHFDYD